MLPINAMGKNFRAMEKKKKYFFDSVTLESVDVDKYVAKAIRKAGTNVHK